MAKKILFGVGGFDKLFGPQLEKERQRVVIHVPLVLPSLNELNRMHWSKRSKLKKQWENTVILVSNSRSFVTVNEGSTTITFGSREPLTDL